MFASVTMCLPHLPCVCLSSYVFASAIAVYIKKNISFDVVTCPIPNAVVIYLLSFNVYVISMYRPPSYNSEQDTSNIDFLYEFYKVILTCHT